MIASHERIVVIGAGGHAAEVCAYVTAIGVADGRTQLLGCIDDYKTPGRAGLIDVLGDFGRLEQLLREDLAVRVVTAVGDNPTRRLLVSRVEALDAASRDWWTLRHPSAVVGPGVEIGAGTCLAPGSIVTTRARLGRHCIVNVHASVSHDAVIGDFVNLNPGAVVAGNVHLGDGCYVGAGATIIDKVTVGAGTVVGAGAVVVEDLPPNVTAVGVPARAIKFHASLWEPDAISRRA
jgi:sugar O-acyltransferase (sialic acid O-acetyltransferase NeuD family)